MIGRPDSRGWLHPADEPELVSLIAAARASGTTLRVRGAGHSAPSAIGSADDRILVLDRFRRLEIDERTGDVTAGAGVRFGRDMLDPHAPDGIALCAFLERSGRALPILAGILHQTVAGFLMTGSGGGSTQHDLAASVTALRFVDGTGRIHQVRRGVDDDLLDAVLVSLGLLGIVTEVTFRTEPRFDVAGTETMLPDRSDLLDLCAEGPRGLEAFLQRTEYARILWWPQRGVRRVAIWQARRVSRDDPEPANPYDPMPPLLGVLPTQAAAGAVLWGMTHWRRVPRLFGTHAAAVSERAAAPLEALVYRAFVPVDAARPQRFRGPWCDVLPQDLRIDERWMPTTFTEVFIPIERAAVALRRLNACFDQQPSAAGRFAIECYAAPASSAWLNPSSGRPSLRINVFWLMHAPDDPRDEFFPRIWAALAELSPRLHWGKIFPHQPASAVADRYPRLRDFLDLRDALDPDRVFATEWLDVALGRTSVAAPLCSPLPGARMPRSGLRWPLLFSLQPGRLDLLERADFVYDHQRTIAATGEDALRAMFEDGRFNSFSWLTAPGEFADAVVDEEFSFMRLRLRTLRFERGRLLAMAIDRSSLPLGREVVEYIETTPVDGGCRLRLRVAVKYLPGMKPLAPPVVPLFRKLFETTLDALEARFKR